MKRLLTALLCLQLVFPGWVGFAATYWAREAATGAGDGSTFANSASIATLNARTNSAGDVINVTGATVTRITVHDSGSGPANSQLITYYGGGRFSSPFTNTSTFTANATAYGMILNGKNYIRIAGFQFGNNDVSHDYTAITSSGNTGIVVEDNFFTTTYNGEAIGTTVYRAIHTSWIVRHNIFKDIGLGNLGFGGPQVLDFWGNHNLTEYNVFTGSLDRQRPNGNFNVIRNNYDAGSNAALYTNSASGGATQYPNHTDFDQITEDLVTTSWHLVDRNWEQDNGDGGFVGAQKNQQHFYLGQPSTTSDELLMRFNVVARVTDGFVYTSNTTNSIFYNNTANSTLGPGHGVGFPLILFESTGAGLANMAMWNNMWENDSAAGNWYTNHPYDTFTPTPRYVDYDGTYLAGQINAGSNNIGGGASTDPLFNTGTDVYTLQSGSPLKATGGKAGTANGAGVASTSLTMNTPSANLSDAHAIFDGWSTTTDKDWIKIGSGAYVQVSSINYSTNVVTLAATRSWSNGDAVLVKGNEDVGAQPFTYTATPTVTNTTATSSPTNLTATTTTTEAVRGVEFLVGGLPIGIAYYDGTGSFTVSNTPSGAQTVEARALNYWASQTPTVSAFLLVNQDPTVLAAGTATATTIPLTWTDNSAGVDTYSIETSLDNVTFTVNNVTAAGASSGTATSLASSTLYYVKVRALSGGAYSGYSNTVSTTTASAGGSSSAGVGGKVTLGGKVTVK